MADQSPPDFTTAVGKVRNLIPDTVEIPEPQNPNGPKSYLFSDGEIQAFLDIETLTPVPDPARWHILRAAAMAMTAVANDTNLTLKKLTTEDLETDGPAVADKLLKAAKLLFDRADAAEFADGNVELFIDVPYVHTPPRYDWR